MWKHGSSYTSPCKGHHVDTCLKTVMQFDYGHNTAIAQGNVNDKYGPVSVTALLTPS